MNKKVVISIGVIALAIVLIALALNRKTEIEDTLDIALNLPLSGPIAVFMDPIPNALRMGLEDGGAELDLQPDFFGLDVQDNAGKPALAATVLQKQALSGFDIYISGSTEMTMAVIDEIDQTRVPHFLIAFDAYMTGKGENRLRVLPNYKLEGPLWVEYAKTRNAKRVFALTLNNPPIEEEFSKIVDPGLADLGVELQRERFEWEGSDYRTLALKAKEFKPDLIMVNGYSVHLYPALSALRSQGLINDGNTIAALDFVDMLYNDTPKSELTDIAFMCPKFELSNATSETKQWRQKYESRFGSRPSYVAAYAYDTGRLLAGAYQNDGKVHTQDLLNQLPFEGVSGLVELDSDRDLNSTLTIARLDDEQKVVEIE